MTCTVGKHLWCAETRVWLSKAAARWQGNFFPTIIHVIPRDSASQLATSASYESLMWTSQNMHHSIQSVICVRSHTVPSYSKLVFSLRRRTGGWIFVNKIRWWNLIRNNVYFTVSENGKSYIISSKPIVCFAWCWQRALLCTNSILAVDDFLRHIQ